MKKLLLLSFVFLIALVVIPKNTNAAKTDSTMVARELSNDPLVDGIYDAVWNEVPYTSVHNLKVNNALSASDFDVKFKIGWKINMVYVLIEVIDDKIVIDPGFANYLQDYTMIIFDFIKDKGDFADKNSFWYRSNADASKIDGRYNGSWTAPESGVIVGAGKINGGYLMEYSIDSYSFGVIDDLAVGQRIGFDLETGDNDDQAVAQRTSQYFWSTTSTGNDYATPLGQVGYVTLTGLNTSVKSLSNQSLNIFPNPTKEMFRLNCNASLVEIYSLTGSKVKSFSNVKTNTLMSVNNISGIYLLKVYEENGNVTTKRLVVK